MVNNTEKGYQWVSAEPRKEEKSKARPKTKEVKKKSCNCSRNGGLDTEKELPY